jgi:hypothetical protein
VGQRLLIKLNTDWAEQTLSDWNVSKNIKHKYQLSTETKQNVLDVQVMRTWKDIKDDPHMSVESDLSYYFEFIGTHDAEYIGEHKTWGFLALENDESEEEVSEREAFEAKAAATSAKRKACADFF